MFYIYYWLCNKSSEIRFLLHNEESKSGDFSKCLGPSQKKWKMDYGNSSVIINNE